MRRRYLVATLVTLGSALAPATTTSALAAAASSAPAPATVLQSSSPVAAPANQLGAAPPNEPIEFNVGLAPGDLAGAAALARAVTDPSSPSYRHFLTPAEWESRFSPSQASVDSVTSWLQSQGHNRQRRYARSADHSGHGLS